jgi:hypothetical protein
VKGGSRAEMQDLKRIFIFPVVVQAIRFESSQGFIGSVPRQSARTNQA